MATLNTIYDIRHGRADIRNRVICALAIAANDVINEAEETPNHAARILWAKAVINDSGRWIDLFMWAVALNSTINTAIEAEQAVSDGDIQFVVNGNIDKAIALVS